MKITPNINEIGAVILEVNKYTPNSPNQYFFFYKKLANISTNYKL